MLTQIQSRTAAAPEEDALTMLVGCHQRIRHFTQVALRIARMPDAPPAELAEAAEAVLRYYSAALPLHEADENETLYPRLRASAADATALAANDAMLQQHAELDDVLAALLPLWQEVKRNPATIGGLAPRLLQQTLQLEQLWQVHLNLEEEIVFPAMQQHLGAELDAIAAEMRARR